MKNELNLKSEQKKQEAAKKIQNFFRIRKKHHAFKQACLASGSITLLRKAEMEQILISPETNLIDKKAITYLIEIRNIKMMRKSLEENRYSEEKQQHPIQAIDHQYTPMYLRDFHRNVIEYVAKKLEQKLEYGETIHIVKKNDYIIKILQLRLSYLQKQESDLKIKSSRIDCSQELKYNNEQQTAINEYLMKLNSKDDRSIWFAHQDEIFPADHGESSFNLGYIGRIFNKTGVFPSYYAIIDSLNSNQKSPSSENFLPIQFTTGLSLEQLLHTTTTILVESKFNLQIRNNLILNIALHLIQGLAMYQESSQVINDTLNQQCFYVLNYCINLMYIYRNTNHLLRYIYDLVIEEIITLLIHNGNPTSQTYTKIFEKLYVDRVPIINQQLENNSWQLSNYLVANGMQAIMIAILSQSNKDLLDRICLENNNYFEIKELQELFTDNDLSKANNIELITLEPSGINEKEYFLMEKIEEFEVFKKSLSFKYDANTFVTIIIDVSIESGTPETNKLQQLLNVLATEITAGKLNIILVKSLQKYSLLGTAKLMAGNISIINNGDEKFKPITERIQQYAATLDLTTSKEYPFLTYFFEKVGKFETLMANKVIANVNFLKKLLHKKYDPTSQITNSPFLFFSTKMGLYSEIKDVPYLFPFSKTDTFGFLETTYLIVLNKYLRLNPGIESKEYLAEIFFGIRFYDVYGENCKNHKIIIEILTDIKMVDYLKEISEERKKNISISLFDIIKLIIPDYKTKTLNYLTKRFNSNNDEYINNAIYSLLIKYGQDFFETEFEKIISELIKTKMQGLSLEAKQNLLQLNFEHNLLATYHLLTSATLSEKSPNAELDNVICTKLTSLMQMANKLFYPEDLLLFIINKLQLKDSRNQTKNNNQSIIILNAILKEHKISAFTLLNIIESFATVEKLNSSCGLFLLNKIIVIINDFPEKEKKHILGRIMPIIDDFPEKDRIKTHKPKHG